MYSKKCPYGTIIKILILLILIVLLLDLILFLLIINTGIHVYFKMYILDLFCELNQLIHLKDLTQNSGSFTKLYFFYC